MNKEELKVVLRDWMTAETQLMKVHVPSLSPISIAKVWEGQYSIKMTERWVNKALYGRVKK